MKLLRFLSFALPASVIFFNCAQIPDQENEPDNKDGNNHDTFNIKWNPGNYIFVGMDGDITDELASTAGFLGVQKGYIWKKLEPTKENYDFSEIRTDLAMVKKYGRRLVIQLQWKCFENNKTYGPDYITTNPDYIYYGNQNNKIDPPYNPRMWDPYVLERFNKLVEKLGEEFDKNEYLEAINLPESAASGSKEELARTGYYPVDDNGNIIYSREKQLYYLKSTMLKMKSSFPNTVSIQYMNWPVNIFTIDKIHEFIRDNGVGMGGPDLRYSDSGLKNGVYLYYPPLAGKAPLGTAVQWPDYDFNGVIADVEKLYLYGRDTLHLNYIFWHPRNPWWTDIKKLVDSITSKYGKAGGLDSVPPSSLVKEL